MHRVMSVESVLLSNWFFYHIFAEKSNHCWDRDRVTVEISFSVSQPCH